MENKISEFPEHIQALDEHGYAPPSAGLECGQCGIDWSKYEAKIAQLEKERAAYREVAIDLHETYDCNGVEKACSAIIDMKATRILEGGK